MGKDRGVIGKEVAGIHLNERGVLDILWEVQ